MMIADAWMIELPLKTVTLTSNDCPRIVGEILKTATLVFRPLTRITFEVPCADKSDERIPVISRSTVMVWFEAALP